MAATVQHCNATTATTLPQTATSTPTNPKLKRIVYSKYRELLGSYNDKANAIIETLPAYMVHEDRGFNFETINSNDCLNYPKTTTTENYGSANGQNSNYEAPACVQNAMMTKDKKPFTYTPGGIDLSQIKSERMAKRLQRNAQAEGSTGPQQPRPAQPQSPGGSAAAAMGAAAMGMPFQVLPPPPPPPQPGMAGKKPTLNGSTPAPPPPPPTNTFSNNTKTLAPPSNGGGPGSAPGSPNMARKSPTPQRFEPPPMGFRPEIKIPPNPMAALRKVPPPVEKNTFWKEAYVKERSKSPMVGENDRSSSPAVSSGVTEEPQSNWNNPSNISNQNNNYNYVNDDSAMRKPAPATATSTQQQQQQVQPDLYTYNNVAQQQSSQPRMQSFQQQHNTPTPPPTPPVTSTPQQQQNSPRSEYRSVTAPQSPAVNVYTRQTDSPRSAVDGNSPQQQQQQQQNENRSTESPFRFAQQQHIQRPPAAMSPLAQQQRQTQQSSFHPAASGNVQAQTVPWRTQRSQPPQQQQQQQQQRQASPQPIYNNVQQSQQQDRGRSPGPREFNSQFQQPVQQQQAYEKPTSVGSLYIAPLAQPVEPQAQHIVRQQLQQQQQQRNSPMRQLGGGQQQPQQQLRWMSSQPAPKEQPAWLRNEDNGNVMPSSLQRLKSPPPPAMQQQQQQQQYQQPYYQPSTPQQQQSFAPQQSNGFGNTFGSQPTPATIGLRLQINTNSNNASSNGPRERIIPIQLEQTPTNTPNEPNFGNPNYGQSNTNSGGYIVRSPNQFVDQGYNNFAAAQQQQQQQQQQQRVMSPHITQQQQLQATNNVSGGNKTTRIIPIAFETSNSGPVSSSSPIVFQNDSRTPPIQSKSFRILQKITDTVDDGSSDDQTIKNNVNNKVNNNTINDNEPVQLQRPQFARQMSAQEAKSSPPNEQMRRIQIGHEQGNTSAQQNRSIQRPSYDQPQQYIPPSEQQAPEPKKYTGSAIPSRSFKLLQAMTTPENAEQSNLKTELDNSENNDLNDKNINYNTNTNEKQEQDNNKNQMKNDMTNPLSAPNTGAETATQNHNIFSNDQNNSNNSTNTSANTINANNTLPKEQPQNIPHYPAYVYPYPPYPWYPPAALPPGVEPPSNWPYAFAYGPPPHIPQSNSGNSVPTQQPIGYPPYPFFYAPFYPPNIPPPNCNQSDGDVQNVLESKYLPTVVPPYPYAYPIAPSVSQSSTSSRASSVVPDIIITPSSDEKPSKVVLQHHIHVEKRDPPKRTDSLEIEEVATKTVNNAFVQREKREGSVIDVLSKKLNDITKLSDIADVNLSHHTDKFYAGENAHKFEDHSPTDNASTVPIVTLQQTTDESCSESTYTSDEESEITPNEAQNRNHPLQSIRSVTNVQFYKRQNQASDDCEYETEDDDVTTADGKSDIFDEESIEYNTEEANDEIMLEIDPEVEDLSTIYEEESDFDHDSDFRITTTSYRPKMETPVVELKDLASEGRSKTEQQKQNSFSIAKIDIDNDDDDSESDCEVSVTISLNTSSRSRSNSVEKKDEPYSPSTAYPAADVAIPEEDVDVAFSLNLRNKFMSETMQGQLTNNIAEVTDKIEENETNTEQCITKNMTEIELEKSPTFDFFGTLKATKLQAQKMLETSKNYWGSPAEDAEKLLQNSTEEKVCSKEAEDVKRSTNKEKGKRPLSIDESSLAKAKNDFWATVAEAKKSTEAIKETLDEDFENLTKNLLEKDAQVLQLPQSLGKLENVKTEFEVKPKIQELDFKIKVIQKTELEKIKENLTDDSEPNPNTKKNVKITTKKDKKLQRDSETTDKPKQKKKVGSLKKKKETTQKTEVKIEMQSNDIHIKEDKDTNTALKTYSETIKVEEKIEENTKETLIFEQHQENDTAEEEIDFWAEIEQSRSASQDLNKLTDASQTSHLNNNTFSVCNSQEIESPKDNVVSTQDTHSELSSAQDGDSTSISFYQKETSNCSEHNTFGNVQQNYKQLAEVTTKHIEECSLKSQNQQIDSSFTEVCGKYEELHEETEEIDFWAEISKSDDTTSNQHAYCSDDEEIKPFNSTIVNTYDSANYPEEPREVDTDEEIDFWAEIESKRTDSNQDVTFHSAATFWAKRDGQNSAEETPYKPVEKKAFNAKLSDEASVDINLWAALEAAKGEEPEFIDPAVEEEGMLAQEYNILTEPLNEPDQSVSDQYKIQETSETNKSNEDEPDFWAEIETERERVNLKEEAEIKRTNYRKAMAFFSTSIDDHKDQNPTKNDVELQSLAEAVEEKEEEEEENVAYSRFSSNSTPTNVEESSEKLTKLPAVYVESIVPDKKYLPNGLPDLGIKNIQEENKISVKDRISVFEGNSIESGVDLRKTKIKTQSLSVESYTTNSTLSRNSSAQLSEEDDSGVTDMNKPLSETDTESESFPELRKMSSYQRAATHSRLFKLLQDETDLSATDQNEDEFQLKPSRRKIVHNVSITRKQNPQAVSEAETMTQRRERLSLPLRKNTSIDADNPSTPNSPASPTICQSHSQRTAVSDKLVNELIQSLLLKSDSTHLRNLPMEKLQAAAKRALEEELDTVQMPSNNSIPGGMTSNSQTENTNKSYADYYNTWADSASFSSVPSKSIRSPQDSPRRSPLTVRCPRVLSSKTINRDLARVTESPEIHTRNSNSPEIFRQSRERSVSIWRK